MNKKPYEMPGIQILDAEPAQMLCNSVTNIDGNSGIGYGGGGSGPARAPMTDDWDFNSIGE